MADCFPSSFAAILVAGGSGTRFRQVAAREVTACLAAPGQDDPVISVPKQFTLLAGRPMYAWPLDILLETDQIDRVVMVVPPSMVAQIDQDLDPVRKAHESKTVLCIAGGASRQGSVRNGLSALNTVPPDFVLIHDAARPFITSDTVEQVLAGVIKYGAVTTGMPVTDTIKIFAGEFIDHTVPRESLLAVQTPQAGRYQWLVEAHDLAEKRGASNTDDAGIMESAGHKVGIVRGASFNLKITNSEDMVLANALAAIVLSDRL